MPFALPVNDCRRCPVGAACAPATCAFVCERKDTGRHLSFVGTPIERVVFVKRGYLALHRGPGTPVALRSPGAMVGIECLGPRASVHTATAITDVEVCSLGAADFRSLATRAPSAVLGLLTVELGRRDRDESFRTGPADARVARLLLERLRRGGAAHPLPFNQRTFARVLALRPETLSRVLTRLRSTGVIGDGGFVIDAVALADLAEGRDGTSVIPRT